MLNKAVNLSESIDQGFRADIITQCGISGTITAMAYDPVQSLYAVGTDIGKIHVMGAGEIRCVFDPNPKRKSPNSRIIELRFATSVYLVSIDERSLVVVWALDTRSEWARYQSPYTIESCCWVDPAMDWMWMGHKNGEITVFDIDRGHITPYKIRNLERECNPKHVMGSVISISMHPRDPALILVCYHEVAVVYNIVKKDTVYVMDGGVPIANARWHPSGSHVVTLHVNGTLTFWDGLKGVKLSVRSVFNLGMDRLDLNQDRIAEEVAWCCREDPTDTYLLVWGGRNIVLIEFGFTPVVATTSYDSMGAFFRDTNNNQRELILGEDIRKAQLIPKLRNPHFQGCYNPSNIILLTENQLLCVTLPDLVVNIFDSTVLPAPLSWRAAPITFLGTANITRNRWIGMMAAAPPNVFITGGSSATQQIRKLQLSTSLIVGYANGTVKLFDATRADSRDYRVIMTSVAGLDTHETDVSIIRVSVGRETGEMAIATASGNVFLATFGKNKGKIQPGPPPPCTDIVNVEHLVNPSLHQGFIPKFLYFNRIPVTALCNSNIGFVGIGLNDGRVVIIDRRGPAVIMDETIRGVATAMEFGILTCGEDPYSSILLSVGTSKGEIFSYRIIPRPEGGYQAIVSPSDVICLSIGKSPIIHLSHIDTKEGRSAEGLPEVMARLAGGLQVPGGILACSAQEARFFAITATKSGAKPGKKLGSKSFDVPLLNASYAYLRWGSSSALITVNAKGKCGIYSLPVLKKISSNSLPIVPGGDHVTISEMSDIFIPYESKAFAGSVIRAFGTEQTLKDDELWSVKYRVPARPAISTVHWMTGRLFVKPSDLDTIIAGKRRGKSKRARNQLVDESALPEVSKDQPNVGNSNGPRSWFGNKSVPKFEHPKIQYSAPQKTWGQTFNEYYENAEATVNNVLDDAMESMNSGRKQAQSSAVSGIIGSKFGF